MVKETIEQVASELENMMEVLQSLNAKYAMCQKNTEQDNNKAAFLLECRSASKEIIGITKRIELLHTLYALPQEEPLN